MTDLSNGQNQDYKAGFVGIVGPTNSGKSTLTNALTGVKVSIVSAKQQTTYHGVRGIVTGENEQLVVTDTPGYQRHREGVARLLNKVADKHAKECDVLAWVLDASNVDRAWEQFEALKKQITEMKPPAATLLVLNKVDKMRDRRELLPLIQRFHEEYPRIKLKVQEGYSGHVLEWLATGQLDIAVLYDSASLRGNTLETDPLLSDELFLIGAPSDPARVGHGPVRAARLAEIPLVLPSRPHGIRVLVDEALERAGSRQANVQMEIDALHSMVALAEGGVGYTVLSYSAVRDLALAARVRVWRIVDPVITRSLVLATATQRPSTKPARALTRLFKEKVGAHVRDGLWAPPPELLPAGSLVLGSRAA